MQWEWMLNKNGGLRIFDSLDDIDELIILKKDYVICYSDTYEPIEAKIKNEVYK